MTIDVNPFTTQLDVGEASENPTFAGEGPGEVDPDDATAVDNEDTETIDDSEDNEGPSVEDRLSALEEAISMLLEAQKSKSVFKGAFLPK